MKNDVILRQATVNGDPCHAACRGSSLVLEFWKQSNENPAMLMFEKLRHNPGTLSIFIAHLKTKITIYVLNLRKLGIFSRNFFI